MAKVFRGSLFGYKKKDVQKYVEEMAANFEAQLNELKAELEKRNLEAEELEAKKAMLESQKEAIAEAMAVAREEEGKILADANKNAQLLVQETKQKTEFMLREARESMENERAIMQRKLADENQRLIKIRREILNIRRNAIRTLNNLNLDTDETENIDEK